MQRVSTYSFQSTDLARCLEHINGRTKKKRVSTREGTDDREDCLPLTLAPPPVLDHTLARHGTPPSKVRHVHHEIHLFPHAHHPRRSVSRGLEVVYRA